MVRNGDNADDANSAGPTLDAAAAHDALERFVMDNEDLLELDAMLGKFNLFDAVGMGRSEIRHSTFLAWLLNPLSPHGAGNAFLRAVAGDMLRSHTDRHTTQHKASGLNETANLTTAAVRTEFNGIDILIECRAAQLVIAIENKVDAQEHGDQLQRYHDIAEDVAKRHKLRPILIFLTPNGDSPSDDRWVAYSYRQLADALAAAHDEVSSQLNDGVSICVDNYLQLIRRDVLQDNDKITEICRQLYRNHTRAVTALVRYVNRLDPIIFEAREAVLNEAADFVRLLGGSAVVRFIPHDVARALPEIGGSKSWLTWRFDRLSHDRSQFRMVIEADKCPDPSAIRVRARVLDAIVKSPTLGVRLAQRRSVNTMNSGNVLRLSKGKDTTLLTLNDDKNKDSDIDLDIDLAAVRAVVSRQIGELRLQVPDWVDAIERAKTAVRSVKIENDFA